MERNIKADTWSSLQAKNLGFFLGILSDLLGLSQLYSSSKQQHHIFFIPVNNLDQSINTYHANIQDYRKNTPMATSESPTATALQDGKYPPYMETIAGCRSETNQPP